MKRDKSLDIAKGIAIILMMYGHLRYTYLNMDTVYCWIYSFHMPFFIYISGVLTTCKEDGRWKQVISKAKRILLPYVIWNIVGFGINRAFQFEERTVGEFIHGLIFGDNLNSNLPTWYLMSFLWITVFAIFVLPLLDTVKRLVIADVIAVFFVFVVAYYPKLQDYFRWKGTVVLLPFFITGYLLKKIEFRIPWWLLPVLFYIGFKLSRINAIRTWDYVTVGSGMVGVPYLYLLSAICTVLAMIEFCRYLSKVPGMDVFGVFGRNSLVILCTHWLLGNVIATKLDYGMKLFFCVFVIECVIIICCEIKGKYESEKKKRNCS